MPIAWIDVPDPHNPPPGAIPTSAANLNKLAVIADVGTAGTPTGDAGRAAYVARQSQLLAPQDFGAKGDGRTVTDAVLNSTTSLTSATAAFTSADVGKAVVVLPAPGSTQATLATTISAVNSATSATLATAAPYSGSGLEATVATDDTTALQAWLSSTSRLTRYLPGGIYGFTAGLQLGGWYDVLCATGATLKVMAQLANPTGWPGGARVVPTAIWTSFTTLNTPNARWTGGTLDTSDLATDGFAPKYVRQYVVDGLTVRGARSAVAGTTARMFAVSDPTISGTTYQVVIRSCLGWRDFGAVPVGSTALNSGGTAGSVGLYFDATSSDSTIDGKTVMMGNQVGVDLRGQNIHVNSCHAWARVSIGNMDYGFDDAGGSNIYGPGCYADTPFVAGYRARVATPNRYYGATCFNNTYGTDNAIFGWILDSPRVGHTLSGVAIQGADATHRIAAPLGTTGGANVTASHPFSTALQSNVVIPQNDSQAPLTVQAASGATASLFTSYAGQVVEVANSTAVTFTINAGLFTNGQSCEIVQTGAGQITFVAGSGVTLRSYAGLTTRGQYARVRVFREAGSETFTITGDLTPGGARGQAMQSGYWYSTPASSVGTVIPTNGTMRASKLVVGSPCTLNAICTSVTVAGSTGALVRLGIYADAGDAPGALLVDAGTVDGTVVGQTAATISLPVAAEQVLWLAVVTQGAPTTGPTVRNFTAPTALGDTSAATVLDNDLTAAQATGITGALPTTTTWTRAGNGYRAAVKAA